MPALLEPPRYFRSQELERILGILRRRRPAVVVVNGAPGMGKSSLIRELRIRAAALGWQLADSTGEGITIGRDTTQDTFRDDVALPLPDPAVPSWMAGSERSDRADDTLVDALGRRAHGDPLLIAVEDFRPSPAFGSWFERRFIPALLASDLPVVVVLVQRLGGAEIRQSATDIIELGQLAPEFVEEVLAELSPTLDPPLTDIELRSYARHARTPLLLDSLIRALSLAQTPEPER